MTRSERAALLEKAGEQIKGLRTEPYKTAFLDLCERLDAEGVGQTLDSLFSQIRGSGQPGGFLLETFCAASLLDVPQPRQISCERQEGIARSPGDIWLDFGGKRYEFPCKKATNWTVELWMNNATDTIAKALADVEPGSLYALEPAYAVPEAAWVAFGDWFIANYLTLAIGREYPFTHGGQLVTKVELLQPTAKGVRLGISHSPGGVVLYDTDLLRDKIKARLNGGRRTLSARASPTQINCLLFDIVNYQTDDSDVVEALYGGVVDVYSRSSNTFVDKGFAEGGLWYTGHHDEYSAVVTQKVEFTDDASVPFRIASTVFPHPDRQEEVKEAFAAVPGYKVVTNTADVGL